MTNLKICRKTMIRNFYKKFRRVLIPYVNCKIEELMADFDPMAPRKFSVVDEVFERTDKISKVHKMSDKTRELFRNLVGTGREDE